MNKNEHIMVRLTKADKERLDRWAARLDLPASHISREAIREKLDSLDTSFAVTAATASRSRTSKGKVSA